MSSAARNYSHLLPAHERPAPAMDALVIRRLHAAGRALRLAELADDLADVLGLADAGAARLGLLSKRLGRLRRAGWLVLRGQDEGQHATRWHLSAAGLRTLARPGALEDIASAPAPSAAPQATPDTDQAGPVPVPAPAPWVGQVVPPRQVNVMHAPAWVPPRWEPARPGATDFARCPRRGIDGAARRGAP